MVRKLIVVLSACMFIYSHSYSQQNLVLNGSFEDTLLNSSSMAQFLQYQIPYWWSAYASPDYFSNYYSGTWGTIPSSNAGYQYPRTGNAYAGFFNFHLGQPIVCEIAGGKLSQPLKAGRKYCAQFFVSLGLDFPNGNFLNASDGFGLYFSEDSPIVDPATFYDLQPQVENSSGNVIWDTSGWVPISGSFIAKGGERYFLLGNFRDAQETVAEGNENPYPYSSYYFVDDVSVRLCDSDPAGSGEGSNFDLPPEPVLPLVIPSIVNANQGTWHFINLQEGTRVILYNTLGQQLFKYENYTNNLPLKDLPAAPYYYMVTLPTGEIKKGKLIVVR